MHVGHIVVEAELSWKRAARVRVLVDTRATHSVLPSDLADRLGVIRSPRSIRVKLADGSHRSMRVGAVLVRLLGREAGDTALIARRGAEPVLGVEALEALGLTAAQARTPAWNPLGALVGPGQHVVIKPNFVSSRNFHHRYAQDEFLCCCTHPSVIRPLIDLAWRALDGHGTISIAEAPLEGGQFENTLAALGVTAMVETLRARDGVPLELIDLRDFQIVPRMLLDDLAVAGRSLNVGALERRPLPGDPRGYRTVDLGAASSFAGLDGRCDGLRFHHSNPGLPSLHHREGRHEYSFGNTVLAADLLISMPKMKSHKKP